MADDRVCVSDSQSLCSLRAAELPSNVLAVSRSTIVLPAIIQYKLVATAFTLALLEF